MREAPRPGWGGGAAGGAAAGVLTIMNRRILN